jgi:potassium-transporting ATPase KdpC subunit
MPDEKPKTVKAMKPAVMLFVVFWFITGIVYPLSVYAVSQLLFPAQAQGSLIHDGQGHPTGSKLIGQPFSGERYFWPRPSMTAEHPYNPLASAGSNLGPTSKRLIDDISNRTERLMEIHETDEIPSDLVTASASGLDPHISLYSAKLQASRVAVARGMDSETIDRLIGENTEKPILGILGEERVNVLLLNRALDEVHVP